VEWIPIIICCSLSLFRLTELNPKNISEIMIPIKKNYFNLLSIIFETEVYTLSIMGSSTDTFKLFI
jgi:hypothetical protein